MRVQDAMAHYTMNAVEMLFRAVRQVPADKLEWKPAPDARSVLDQLQECAQAPIWYAKWLDPSFDHGFANYPEMQEARSKWTTIDECETILGENTAMLIEKIKAVPDDRLSEEHEMPWGMKMSILDMISSHYWNLTYHTGQIFYIQTLYGDKAM